MKTLGISKAVSRIGKNIMKCKPIAKAMVKINKNKPEILAVGGGVCIIAAFGFAIYEAVTIKDALNETSEKVKMVEENRDKSLAQEDLTDEQKDIIVKGSQRDLTKARMEGVYIVARKFILPAGLLVVGMKMGTDGFKILRARNLVLTGALKSTEELFKFYRGNVREDLGKDADLKYMRGVTGEQTVEETKKAEDGSEQKVTSVIPVVKNDGGSNPWRFAFTEENFDSWTEDTDMNLFYLKLAQDWWQHEYDRNDTITIYEVLKYMRYRFDRAKERMSKKQWREFMNFVRNYGWWHGSNGDGFVDFGIYRAINEAAIRRTSDLIYVEFNCDGCLQTM